MKDDGLIKDEIEPLDIYIMPLGEEVQYYCLTLANKLRLNGYACDLCFDNVKLGNMFKRATKKNAKYAIIVGENEIKNQKLIVKDLAKEEQEEIEAKDAIDYFDAIYNIEENKTCKCSSDCCESGECK